jgi:hypothetical protein
MAFGHEDRMPTHGYAETREAANGSVRQKLGGGNEKSAAGNSGFTLVEGRALA